MSDNYLKTPFAKTLNAFAEKKVHKGIQATGRSLPCSVVRVVSSGVVEVQFEVEAAPFTLPNVVVAKAGSEYVRIPTQVGDRGVVMAADARLGGVTGLGAGIASLAQPGNLAALVFVPLGNTDWSDEDPDAVVLIDPTGAAKVSVKGDEISATLGDASVTVTPDEIALTLGEGSIIVTSAGVSITGALVINGQAYLLHKHTGVTVGAGQTGGVAP